MKKKIALATSWNERCGIASYASNLVKHCPWFEFDIVPRTFGPEEIISHCAGYDVMCLNYEPGLFPYLTSQYIRRCPIPSVLILHTSHEGDNRTEFTNTFTRVVVHEKTQEGFTFIPHGIPTYKGNGEVEFDIGTVGFPFPWKGFTEVVLAAKELNKTCLVIIPESRHTDTFEMKTHLLSLYNKVTVVTEWLSEEKTIDMMAGCKVLAFPYHGGNYGISGACRLGLATGNPIVLSTSRQFRDLFDYSKEIEFIGQPPTADKVVQGIKNLFNNRIADERLNQYDVLKWPEKVLQDMNWNKAGMLYKKLFEEVMK